jgi:hypothetical protein
MKIVSYLTKILPKLQGTIQAAFSGIFISFDFPLFLLYFQVFKDNLVFIYYHAFLQFFTYFIRCRTTQVRHKIVP